MSAPGLDRVRSELESRTPVDDREARAVERTLNELELLDQPYSELAQLTHVTGSAIVLRESQILLLRHKRLGIWLQPGGHIEAAESPWEAALREAREETGLDFDPGPTPWRLAHVDVHDAGRGHVHVDLRYSLDVVGDPHPRPPPAESQEIGWFDLAGAADATDPGLSGLLKSLG